MATTQGANPANSPGAESRAVNPRALLCGGVNPEGAVESPSPLLSRVSRLTTPRLERRTSHERNVRPTNDAATTGEIREDLSSEATDNDEASQNESTLRRGMPTVVVNEKGRPLFNAALNGDWKAVKKILDDDREAMTTEVMTVDGAALFVLYVAVVAERDQLVENLVKRIPPEHKDEMARNALLFAVWRGRLRMVKVLTDQINGKDVIIPEALALAITCAPKQKEVIWYLARRTTSDVDVTQMAVLIKTGNMALKQLKVSLWNLATTAVPFIKWIVELKLRHKYSFEFVNLALIETKTLMKTPEILEFSFTDEVVKCATLSGISEIVKSCLKHYPELMWKKDMISSMIILVSKRRHVELFRLLNPYSTITQSNICEYAKSLMEAIVEPPRCVPADVSGAAFFMQRELQWYKVVEDSVGPYLTDVSWVEGRHWEHFVEKRQDLLKKAGQWMKDTASSCSLVATLIITIAFAAAFTMPGGNDNNTGIPIFLKKPSFMVFAAADALALFSSITATLMFWAILTSRYAAEDFLLSLPRKIILGLTFLFLSLAFMLVAFGSALTIVLSEKLKWIGIPITLLAAFPIVSFIILQLPLYVEMVESTYWPRLYRPLKIWK